jgi:hypothetical protein
MTPEQIAAGSICGVPLNKVYRREVETRWCFAERKRLRGVWTLAGPSFETLMATEAWGWAEPVWSFKCDGCGRDAHEFGSGW